MSGKVTSASDPEGSSHRCIVCRAVPTSTTDQFCRRCGCRLNLSCKYCNAILKPLDRFCPSCGTRRLIIFDQLRQAFYLYSPYVALGTAVVLGSAWLALRYALRDKLHRR
ncbi:hypothetical protein Q1695_009572 [Nippostrongylus brasiliensis]|nr:hypothetical protein Q1695_009572 [Nippostrongylus brasiliensis]